MKKILYFLTTTLILSVVVSSCTKVPLPYDTYEDLKKGAFARLLSQDGAFDFFNPTTSGITSSVEFYDEAQGGNIQSYSWTVEFVDNSPGFGSGSLDPVDFITFTSDQFSPNSDTGYPSITFTFGFQDAMDALGLTIGDVTGGDVFRFEATITKSDGTTFTANNTGSNIFSSSTFAALFTIDATVVCLPTPGYFTGTYTLELISADPDPWTGMPRFADRTTEVIETSSTGRKFEVTWLPSTTFGPFNIDMEIDMVCGEIIVDTYTGLGCADGVYWVTDTPPATYDPNDDSVMTIKFIDDATDDCGVLQSQVEFRMTKQ